MKKNFLFICLVFLFFQNSISQVSMNMNLLDNWDQSGLNYNDVWGYVDGSGNEYAILGSRSKIHFFEITTSNTLSLIDEFTPGATSTWRDFKTYGNFAYACTEGNEGLLVYDLSNLPSSVSLAQQITSEFSRAHNIYIDEAEGKLYVVGSNTQSNGLIIYDVTTSPPTHLASVPLPGGGYVHDIYVRNDTAYASHGWNGFYIWDVSNPSSPGFLASYTGEPGYNHSSWVTPDGNTAFYAREVGTGLPMTALDLSDYNDLEVISNFQFPLLAPNSTDNTPHNPYLVGDYLYTSYYEDGIEVFDVSDPENVTLAGYYDTYPSNTQYNGYDGCWGTYPFLPSGRILGSDDVNGLFLLGTSFNSIPPLELNLVSQTNASCNGGSNGIIEVTAANGTPPYTYTIVGGSSQSSGIFTNLSAGAYIVEVTDADNDVEDITVTITQPDLIIPIIIQQQNVTCNGGMDGSISASAVGGTVASNYFYSINGVNFSSNNTFTSLTSGTYILTVRDDNNCESALPFTISQPDPLQSFINTQTEVDCFGNNSGAIEFNTVGGTQSYLYSLNQVNYQASSSFSNLLAGNYTLYTLDVNNCISETFFTISEPALLEISVDQQTNVDCFGDTNGEVILNGQGGTGNYQYNIDGENYQTSATFSNLTAGSYDFNIKDANDCIASLNVTITSSPEIVVQISEVTQVECFGGNTGSVTLQLSGGAGNFNTTMNGNTVAGSTVVFSNLTAGIYPILIEDGNNCTTIESIVISENPEVQLFLTSTQNVTCNGFSDGAITVNTIGGNGNYSYSINGTSNGLNNTFTNLSAGQYSITTIDDLGCEDIITVDITEPSAIQVNLVSQTNESCSGANDGSATVQANGGVGNFQYTLNGITNSTGVFNNLTAGNYNVVILDGNTCIENLPFLINSTNPIVAQIDSQTEVDCFGNNNGSIQVSASGGNSNFTFDLGTQSNSTGFFQNLTAGNFTISITDANNCQTTIDATIVQPSEISPSVTNSQNVNCFGGNSGSFQIQASGGTGNYTFSMGNETNSTGLFENLVAGTYTVSITDANNCLSTFETTISQPDLITSFISASQNVNCFGEDNGSLEVQASGGTGNLIFTLGNETNSTGIFENLEAGNYNIIITDENNCSISAPHEVTEPSELTISTTTVTLASCNGQEGSIQVAAQGGTLPYQFSNGSNSNSTGLFENLTAGIYMVSVTDGNNCMTSIEVDIIEPNALNIEITQTQNPLCPGDNSGTIQLQAMGGTGIINYTLGNETNTSGFFQNLNANTYNITVTDENNCMSLIEVALTEPPVLEISNNQTINVNCFGENNGSINLSASGGTGILTFSLGNESNTTGNFENLEANNYNISVEDENGCSTFIEINITEPTVLTSEILQTTPIDCAGGNNGMIQFEANGGAGNYEFSLNGQTNSTGLFENLPADDYMMNLTDDNGCTSSQNVTLTEPLAITIDFLFIQNTLCNGENSGSISVNAGGGIGQFEFSLGNETNTTGLFENLPSGNYNIIVTDENDCQSSVEANIFEAQVIVPNIEFINPILCQGDANGVITATATGGNGDFQYTLDSETNSTGIFENLADGIYVVSIVDQNNCTSTIEFEIDEPQQITTSISQTQNVLCAGEASGSFEINATGGTGTHTFILNGSSNTTGIFDNLSAGVFEVTILDENDCETTETITLTEPDELNLTLENTQMADCAGATTGGFEVQASGGVGNYTYSISNQTNSDGIFENLASGIYDCLVTDENDCIFLLPITVNENNDIELNEFNNINVACFGDENGSISISVSGGMGDFTFSLGNETNETGFFQNLPAGIYNVTATDINDCSAIFSAQITEPDVLELSTDEIVNVPCFGESTGSVQLLATGGSGNFDFSMDGSSNASGLFENLPAGNYDAIVTDENNCNNTITFEITEAPELIFSIINLTNDTGNGNGSVTFEGTGGTPPYLFSLDGLDYQEGMTFTILTAGNYTGYLQDANGCVIESPFEIILETSISNPDLGVLDMNVFPNPFSEKIILNIDLAFAQTINLEMINISGQTILQNITNVESGKQIITLDVENNIPAGIYFLSVKNEDQAIGYFKIIKQ
ncbi:MAG: choice-of-anchor B family protein [Saprospiraceae bacterium]